MLTVIQRSLSQSLIDKTSHGRALEAHQSHKMRGEEIGKGSQTRFRDGLLIVASKQRRRRPVKRSPPRERTEMRHAERAPPNGRGWIPSRPLHQPDSSVHPGGEKVVRRRKKPRYII